MPQFALCDHDAVVVVHADGSITVHEWGIHPGEGTDTWTGPSLDSVRVCFLDR